MEKPHLRNLDIEARLSEVTGGGLEGGHELDGAHQAQFEVPVQVGLQGLDKVEAVEFDIHKHVKHLYPTGPVHGDEAAVAVVHHEVTAQGPGGVIINTTGPVCNIRHDHCLRACKLRDKVGRALVK